MAENKKKALGPYDPDRNYCGPNGLLKFPRRIYGIDCNYAFYIHDKHYIRGGTKHDRLRADKAMYFRMMYYIKEAFPIKKKWGITYRSPVYYLAWRRARKYYRAVRVGGWAFFSYAKGGVKRNDA